VRAICCPQLVEICRRAVGQDGFGAASEHRRPIAPSAGQELGRGYRVDTVVDAVKPSSRNPSLDPGPAHAERQQLGERDNAVLPDDLGT
jgi:hypothetical protein